MAIRFCSFFSLLFMSQIRPIGGAWLYFFAVFLKPAFHVANQADRRRMAILFCSFFSLLFMSQIRPMSSVKHQVLRISLVPGKGIAWPGGE